MEAFAQEWRAACTADGVRISSATLNSGAIVPPPSKTVLPGGSFQATMAHAATEKTSEPRPRSDAAASSAQEKMNDQVGEQTDAATTGSAELEDTTASDLSAEHSQATGDATAADTSLATAAASTGVLVGAIGSAAVESSSDAFLRQTATGSLAPNAGFEGFSIHAVDVPTTATSTSGTTAKQDRSKAQTDLQKTTAIATIAAVADPVTVPVVNVVNLQGAGHRQEGVASENSIKDTTFEKSVGMHGKMAASTDGPGAVDTGSALLSATATSSQQGTHVQVSAEPFQVGFDLSMAVALSPSSRLANPVDLTMPAGNSIGTGFAAANAASSRVSDGANNTKSAATGTMDTMWYAASDSQAAPSSQTDAPKAGAGVAVSRATDNGAAQTTLQALLTPVGSHESTTAQHATADAPDAAHAGRAADLLASTHLAAGEGTPATGINSAKLIQTMGETEMHVGMHSAEFGDISIRTSLSQLQMVTQISVAHNDLSQTISSHLSTVQAKLGEEYGLHASIQVNNQGTSFSGGHGNSPQRDQPSPGRSTNGRGLAPAEIN